MSYKKMRKLLIFLLLFCNIFMLFNLVSIRYSSMKLQNQMNDNNIEFLAQKGINLTAQQLNTGIVELNSYKYSIFSQKNAELLLENAISAENDVYIGDNGSAKVDELGNFNIILDNSHTESSIKELLISAGFDLENAQIFRQENSIEFTYKIGDFAVSNCSFKVILNTNTTTIEGTYVFETAVIGAISTSQTVFTLMVDFANLSSIKGDVAVLDVYFSLSQETAGNISPVLELEINNKRYFYYFLDGIITI